MPVVKYESENLQNNKRVNERYMHLIFASVNQLWSNKTQTRMNNESQRPHD